MDGIPSRVAFVHADREVVRQRTEAYYAVFQGVLRAAAELCVGGRAHEYGPPAANFIHGDESYLEMVWVKVSRLLNLVDSKRAILAEEGWQAWHEFDRGRFADTLIDLVNYAAFWAADICLSGQWPAHLQAQPEPYYPDPEPLDAEAGVLEDGVETVQCPRCQSLSRGFFGRVDGAWIIGCKNCGYRRTSQQVGALLAWYAETRSSRAFVRGRYGAQGEPTHVVKTVDVKIARKLEEEDESKPEVAVEEQSNGLETPTDTPDELPPVKETAPASVLRNTPPRVKPTRHHNDVPVEEEVGRPDVQPSTSETEPVHRVSCTTCEGSAEVFLVPVPPGKRRLKQFRDKETCLLLRCPTCSQEKHCVDMREVSRFLESKRVAKSLSPTQE